MADFTWKGFYIIDHGFEGIGKDRYSALVDDVLVRGCSVKQIKANIYNQQMLPHTIECLKCAGRAARDEYIKTMTHLATYGIRAEDL